MIDPLAPVTTDLLHDAFNGFRTFNCDARSTHPPVSRSAIKVIVLASKYPAATTLCRSPINRS